MRLVSRSRAPCCRTVLNNCGTASGPSARSRMPIVGPATGTASDPRPRPPGSGARACKRIKSRNCRAPQSPEFVTHRDSRSSAMRRPWRAPGTAPPPGRLCDAGMRQVVGPSPRQVPDPQSISPPGVHERREDGGLAGAGDADRYAASSALPSSSIIRSRCARAPSLRSRCRPTRWPRRSGTPERSAPGRSAVSRFTCKVVASAPSAWPCASAATPQISLTVCPSWRTPTRGEGARDRIDVLRPVHTAGGDQPRTAVTRASAASARRCSCLSIARATSRRAPGAPPSCALAPTLGPARCMPPAERGVLRATRIEAVPIEPLLARILPRRRVARVLRKRRPRAPTPRGSGCSGIGRGVGFAYMTVPVGNAALLNPLRILPVFLRANVPFPTAQAPRRKLLRVSRSASEAKLAASIPFSAILMISWNRCFHES